MSKKKPWWSWDGEDYNDWKDSWTSRWEIPKHWRSSYDAGYRPENYAPTPKQKDIIDQYLSARKLRLGGESVIGCLFTNGAFLVKHRAVTATPNSGLYGFDMQVIFDSAGNVLFENNRLHNCDYNLELKEYIVEHGLTQGRPTND